MSLIFSSQMDTMTGLNAAATAPPDRMMSVISS
jgi:hypothetical protein